MLTVEQIASIIDTSKSRNDHVLVLPSKEVEIPGTESESLTSMPSWTLRTARIVKEVSSDMTIYGYKVIVDPSVDEPKLMRRSEYRPANPIPFDEVS